MPADTKWGEILCPKCKEPKAANASICPHCRTEFTDEEINVHKKELRDNNYAAIGCVIILLLMVAGCSWSFFGQSEGSQEEKAAAVTAYVDGVGKAMAQCDRAYQTHGDEFLSNNPVVGYAAANYVADQCFEAFRAFGELKVPDNLGEGLNKRFVQAHEACKNAYFSKRQAAELVKEVLNGDLSPATQVELTKWTENGSNGLIQCSSLLVEAAQEAGVDASKLLSKVQLK